MGVQHKNRFITADNPQHFTLLLLKRMRSNKLCKRVLEQKATAEQREISAPLLEQKSIELATAIDSALGYWESKSDNLNAQILTRYYSVLQFTIAEQVANLENSSDLQHIQKQTVHGHGLFSYEIEDKNFPERFFIGIIKGGYFYSYLKQLKLDKALESALFLKKPNRDEAAPLEKLVSLSDLLRRIPELCNQIYEHLTLRPLTYSVWYERDNQPINFLSPNRKKEAAPADKISTLGFRPDGEPKLGEEELEAFLHCYPIQGMENFCIKQSQFSQGIYIEADYTHKNKNTTWHEELTTLYSSRFEGTTYIIPAFNVINDPYLLNYIILYGLSIVVRYYPDLWGKIMDGELNHLRSLFEFYISMTDSIIPLEALNRISGYKHIIQTPGGLNSKT